MRLSRHPLRCCVHHGSGDRIRSQGQAADRREGQAVSEIEHDPPGQPRRAPVEQYSPQIHVPVGLLPGRKGHGAVYHRLRSDLGKQGGTVGHTLSLAAAGHTPGRLASA